MRTSPMPIVPFAQSLESYHRSQFLEVTEKRLSADIKGREDVTKLVSTWQAQVRLMLVKHAAPHASLQGTVPRTPTAPTEHEAGLPSHVRVALRSTQHQDTPKVRQKTFTFRHMFRVATHFFFPTQAALLRARWRALQCNLLLQQQLERLHGALQLRGDRGTALHMQIDGHVGRAREALEGHASQEGGPKPGRTLSNAGAHVTPSNHARRLAVSFFFFLCSLSIKHTQP